MDPVLFIPERILSTLLNADFLLLEDLSSEVYERFPACWESVTQRPEFHHSKIGPHHLQHLFARATESPPFITNSELATCLLRWSSGWPADKSYIIRDLITEMVVPPIHHFQALVTLKELHPREFDLAIPPSWVLVMSEELAQDSRKDLEMKWCVLLS